MFKVSTEPPLLLFILRKYWKYWFLKLAGRTAKYVAGGILPTSSHLHTTDLPRSLIGEFSRTKGMFLVVLGFRCFLKPQVCVEYGNRTREHQSGHQSSYWLRTSVLNFRIYREHKKYVNLSPEESYSWWILVRVYLSPEESYSWWILVQVNLSPDES